MKKRLITAAMALSLPAIAEIRKIEFNPVLSEDRFKIR
jgi:hypothetical protein